MLRCVQAELRYKKGEHQPGGLGGGVYDAASVARAYDKRAAAVPYTAEDYAAARARDPELYAAGGGTLVGASSVAAGAVAHIPEANIDRHA